MTKKKGSAKNKNRHGLSRNIPPKIKLQVRQRCGFGCVVCGAGIYHYDHVLPEYKDAKIHDPSAIALLCPSCHQKKTSKFWSTEKISAASRNPICLRNGFIKEVFDFCGDHPSFEFGGIDIKNSKAPITINDEPLFIIKEPEFEGAPFRLSGFFHDSVGNRTLEIIDNEWKASIESWDINISAGAITIKDDTTKTVLKLQAKPPHALKVETLCMVIGPITFNIQNDETQIIAPGFDSRFTKISTGGLHFII